MLDEGRLPSVATWMLDEAEFLSPFEFDRCRAHHDHPYRFQVGERAYWVGYQPAESNPQLRRQFNWRGPVRGMPITVADRART